MKSYPCAHVIGALALLCFTAFVGAAEPAAKPEPAPQERRDPDRFRNFFRPFRTDRAVISPDGRYIAFTQREENKLFILTAEIDKPEKALAKVFVADDESSSPMLAIDQGEKTPAAVNWMRWVTATRLVVETNRITAQNIEGWKDWRGLIMAFNADGSDAKILVKPSDVAELITENDQDRNFSVDRRDNPFNSRFKSVDSPMTIEEDAVSGFVLTEASGRREIQGLETDQAAPQQAIPRSLRIFAIDPVRPNAVTVLLTGSARSRGSRSQEMVSLDINTAKITRLTESWVLNQREALTDRQGNVRFTLPNTLVADFPFRYDYLGAQGEKHAQALDKYLGEGWSGFQLSPENYFGHRLVPLGFDVDPNILYYASNEGRDTYAIYSLDLAAKKKGRFAFENPTFDLISAPTSGFSAHESLIFDPRTSALVGIRYHNTLRTSAWLKPEWQLVQASLEKQFPGRVVDLLDWDQAGNRFVVSVQGAADPGAIYLYDKEKNRLSEFARRAPWIDATHSHATVAFRFEPKDGFGLSGVVTIPREPRMMPAPLVIYAPSVPWQRVRSDFNTDIQALADMGFVVAQINTRGAWGLGVKHRLSVRDGYDEIEVADLVAAVQKLGEAFRVNTSRVALVGFDHGGFVALRALQLHPDVFRCGVVVNAPIELGPWLDELYWRADDVQSALTRPWFGSEDRLGARPLFKGKTQPTKPLLFLQYPGPDGGTRSRTYLDARAYAAKLKRGGVEVQFEELSTDYMRGLPKARAAAFAEIEAFLNATIYAYKIKMGDVKEVEKMTEGK